MVQPLPQMVKTPLSCIMLTFIDHYVDPKKTNPPGEFEGTTFYVTFYVDTMESHIPPNGTYLDIIFQGDNTVSDLHLHYYDTETKKWVQNCGKSTVLDSKTLRVWLCHASQYSVFNLNFSDGTDSTSSSPLNLSIVAGIVVALVVVIAGLLIGIIIYRKRAKEATKRPHKKSHDEDVEMVKIPHEKVIKGVTIKDRLGGGNFGDVFRGDWRVENISKIIC